MRIAKKIFISYRREDSWAASGWLFSQLEKHFPADQLFLDTKAIRPGDQFPRRIDTELEDAAALVVVIGQNWHGSKEVSRLSEPNDYVHREIAISLARGILITPVLIEGTAPPRPEDLPPPIRLLADIQCYRLNRDTFESDVENLVPLLYHAVATDSGTLSETQGRYFSSSKTPGVVFRDFDRGPEMIVIPAGHFLIGSPDDEKDRELDEGPQKLITIASPLAAGRYAITFDEWDYFASLTEHAYMPNDNGYGRGRQPVINVSWHDARAYIEWARDLSGKPYRLLSESEWEYAARAGSQTSYWWGEEAVRKFANYDPGDEERRYGPTKSGETQANMWGLHDFHGNVWEWVEDCWHSSHEMTPTTGEPFVSANCSHRVLRGGAWNVGPSGMRSASRNWERASRRSDVIGFRVARALIG